MRAVTFLPKKIIPLETELLRIYLVPDLPNELQELQHREEHDRGLVYMGGCSEVLTIKEGSGVHITVEQQEPETHACLWEGDGTSMEYEFDPEDFMKAIQLEKRQKEGQEDEGGAAQVVAHGVGSRTACARPVGPGGALPLEVRGTTSARRGLAWRPRSAQPVRPCSAGRARLQRS